MNQPTPTRSWVASANGHADFPLQNLPLGIFSRAGLSPRCGVAIGDSILDLDAALAAGLFEGAAGEAAEATRGGALNAFFALGKPARVALRQRLLELLGEGAAEHPELLHAAAECQMHLPARIGDYTDFYVGIRHAENVGKLFRPDNPLLPNYKHVPIGYHGRASTVRVSGSEVRRPNGQTLPAGASEPVFGPCARLDYELELGIWIGQGNALGEAIPVSRAAEHIAGFCLLNDWSARDIQAWEYQPLGPFLSKSFITSVSPWVVTAEALEPFRRAQPARPEGDPRPLPYLYDDNDQAHGLRHRAGGPAAHRGPARERPAAAAPDPEQQPEHVLDGGADGRPPQRQWLPVAARRPVRLRHPVRRRARPVRLAAGDHRWRQAAGATGLRRDPALPRGRRRGHPPRPLQARGTRLDRFRRMSRQGARGPSGGARMKLYTYYRSTSSYRVRIALALKGLDYQSLPVNLVRDGGEHRQPAYLALNPQGRVPALQVDEGELLIQSPAIIEYLEERYPQPALLSSDPLRRARERGVAALVGCDIHPLHNASVLNLLRQWGHDEEQVRQWIGHWVGQGLAAVEQLIGDQGWCFGDRPGLADVYLVPQLYAAERFGVALDAWPRIRRVADLAAAHPAFRQAHPANQPDTPAA